MGGSCTAYLDMSCDISLIGGVVLEVHFCLIRYMTCDISLRGGALLANYVMSHFLSSGEGGALLLAH